MTIAMASSNSNAFRSSYISSAYFLMLKRHLLRLQKQHNGIHALQDDFNKRLVGRDISLEQLSPLIRQLERHSGYGCFALDIGKLMHPSDYGVFGYVMMNCATLMSALRIACEHKNMLNREFKAQFVVDHDQVIYKIDTTFNNKALQVLLELDFSSSFEFAQRLAGPCQHSLKIRAVHFSHAPLGPFELYRKHFKCPVYFNAPENKIVIDKTVLDTPIYGANPRVLSFLESKVGKLTTDAGNEPKRFKSQVIRYLENKLGGELPPAQEAAQDFNMSLSAFKKKLHIEHSCYQVICDDVRYQHCQALIQKDNVTLKEIAFELGFTNASAFNRAFKRWSGISPSEFKKRSLNNLTDLS